MSATELPDCDALFLRFFDRWYTEDWRRWRGFRATRPDVMQCDEYVGVNGADVSPLDSDGQAAAADMIHQMQDAARHDWPAFIRVTHPIDLKWVDAFDEHYNRARIAKTIEESDPEQFDNAYVLTCCEFGAVLGAVLKSQVPALEWLYAWPYWESGLLHPPSGNIVPVFHWAIKKMSEYGVDDGFAAKIKACSQLLERSTSTP